MQGTMGNIQSNSAPAKSRWWLVVVLVVALIIVVVALVFGSKLMRSKDIKSEYQAVFLNNGQVYFGKLDFEQGWAKLSDVYYLQLSEDLQPASSGDTNTPADTTGTNTQNQQQKIQLVKLGNELHGPQDQMFVAKDKILFWENMKDDSKVMQSIKQYRAQ